MAGKSLPAHSVARQYGDKITVAADPAAPLGMDGGVLDLSRLSDHELDLLEQLAEARLAALEAARKGGG